MGPTEQGGLLVNALAVSKVEACVRASVGTMTPKFAAVLAFLCDERWTNPVIQEMAVVDGMLLIGHEGDCGLNDWTGWSMGDLEGNIEGVASTSELSEEERAWLLGRVRTKITFH